MVNVTIKSRKDTLSNWQTSNPVLSDGEVAVVEIPATDSTPAICLIKIGDGKTNFNTLQYMQSPAADVYAWAKASTKPEYDYSEIKNLTTMIAAGNNITATTKDNKVTIATTQNVAKVPGTLPDIGNIEALPVWDSDEGWKRVDADALKATANTIVKRNASGQIVTAAPTANNHAANKSYVDNQATKIGTSTTKNTLTAIEYLGEADIPATPETGKEYAITDLISYSDLDSDLQGRLDTSNDIIPKTGITQLEITPMATQDISWEPTSISDGTQVATINVVKTSDGKLQVNISGTYATSLDNGINEDFIIGTISVVAGKTYTLPTIDTTTLDVDDNMGGYKWTTTNPFVATTTGTQNLIMHVYYAAHDGAKEVAGMKPISSTVSYTLPDKGLLQKTDEGYVFAEAGNGIAITDGCVSVDQSKVPYYPTGVDSNSAIVRHNNKWATLAYSNSVVANTIVTRTSTGTIKAATPTADNEATTKKYVDTAISGKQDTLTASAGLSIDNNVISVDSDKVPVVLTLPTENKVLFYNAVKGAWDFNAFSADPTPYTIAQRYRDGVLRVGTPTAADHAATKKYVDDAVAGVGGGSSKKVLRFDGNTTAYFDHLATSAYQYTFHLYGETAMDTGNVKITAGGTTLFNLTPDSSNKINVDGTLMFYPASSSSSNTQHNITYSYTASDGTCGSGYVDSTTNMRVIFTGAIGAPASGLYRNWVIQEQISCENWEGLSS